MRVARTESQVSSENLPANNSSIEADVSTPEEQKKPEVHFMHLNEALGMNVEEGASGDTGVGCVEDGPPSEQDGLSVVKQVSDSPPQLFLEQPAADADEENAEPSSET